jgi:hypothetical protein
MPPRRPLQVESAFGMPNIWTSPLSNTAHRGVAAVGFVIMGSRGTAIALAWEKVQIPNSRPVSSECVLLLHCGKIEKS